MQLQCYFESILKYLIILNEANSNSLFTYVADDARRRLLLHDDMLTSNGICRYQCGHHLFAGLCWLLLLQLYGVWLHSCGRRCLDQTRRTCRCCGHECGAGAKCRQTTDITNGYLLVHVAANVSQNDALLGEYDSLVFGRRLGNV